MGFFKNLKRGYRKAKAAYNKYEDNRTKDREAYAERLARRAKAEQSIQRSQAIINKGKGQDGATRALNFLMTDPRQDQPKKRSKGQDPFGGLL